MKRATGATTTTTESSCREKKGEEKVRRRGERNEEKGKEGEESQRMLFPIHHRVLTWERRGEGEKRKKRESKTGGSQREAVRPIED